MYAYVTMALLNYTPLHARVLNNQKKTLLPNFILTLPNLKIVIQITICDQLYIQLYNYSCNFSVPRG